MRTRPQYISESKYVIAFIAHSIALQCRNENMLQKIGQKSPLSYVLRFFSLSMESDSQVQHFSSNVTKRSRRHSLDRNINLGVIRYFGSAVAFTVHRHVSSVTRWLTT